MLSFPVRLLYFFLGSLEHIFNSLGLGMNCLQAFAFQFRVFQPNFYCLHVVSRPHSKILQLPGRPHEAKKVSIRDLLSTDTRKFSNQIKSSLFHKPTRVTANVQIAMQTSKIKKKWQRKYKQIPLHRKLHKIYDVFLNLKNLTPESSRRLFFEFLPPRSCHHPPL